MDNYDVVIVGAGPAGSYLAYKLKNQGIKVLILEKMKFPRYKSCAGGLSKKAYNLLYKENKNIKKVIEKSTNKGLYIRNGKFSKIKPGKELILMTYRSDLDNFLIKIAVDNKTIFFKDNINITSINTKINCVNYIENKKEKIVNYKILVGAWGGNIRFNKIVDIYPFKHFNLSSSWEGPSSLKFKKYSEEYVLTQIFKNYPGFVCYIFPKSKLITAGIFTSKYPFQNVRKDLWNNFMDFWNLDKSIKPKYAIIPIRDIKKPIAKENILLVGDAAGLADAFTGEGIYYAIISSRIAAKQIIYFFNNKKYNISSNYQKNIDSEISDILRWAGYYRFIFNLFPNFSFWFGVETRVGNEIINSFITGEIKYNELSKILKCFFKK